MRNVRLIEHHAVRRNIFRKEQVCPWLDERSATPMLTGMNQEALKAILKDVHIDRLIEPQEIADMIGYCVQNEALNATTIEIEHSNLSSDIDRGWALDRWSAALERIESDCL